MQLRGALVPALVSVAAAPVLAADWPPVPYPHPMITEVLYAVPTGDRGDASGDGTRHVSGDEFVELVNPHDRAIQLRGYVITDRNAPGRGQLRFEFPKMTLGPGEVVVVFNGNEQDWSKAGGLGEAVGDASRPPRKGNDRFDGAFVLTMGITSQREAWANGGDYALLTSPKGEKVQCVTWGAYDAGTPEALVVHEAPECSQGVQWDVGRAAFAEHSSIDGQLFSPGWFESPARDAGREESPGKGDEPAEADRGRGAEPGEKPRELVGPVLPADPEFVGPPAPL